MLVGLGPGDVLDGRFLIVDVLNQGGMAIVAHPLLPMLGYSQVESPGDQLTVEGGVVLRDLPGELVQQIVVVVGLERRVRDITSLRILRWIWCRHSIWQSLTLSSKSASAAA